jgi:hypothetical protein
LGVRALVGSALVLTVLAVSACGESSPSQEELEQARAEGAEEALDEQQEREQRRKLRRLKRKQEKDDQEEQQPPQTTTTTVPEAPSTGIPSTAVSCAEGVYAGPNTSCEFAFNVADAYYSAGQPSTVEAYSPVTGLTYTMSCSGTSPTVCQGGNDASVYLL